MKKLFFKSIFALIILSLVASCSSPRKCGNKKGIKTPMGTM